MSSICPNCDNKLRDDARFCDSCGQSTSSSGARAADAELIETTFPPLQIGDIVDNKYKIVGKLGRGGMGMVYRAARYIGDEVALKALHPEYARFSGMVRRFRREARTAARIKHKNVVQIYEAKTDGGAGVLPYFVMELLEGETLRDILEGAARAGTGLELRRAVRLMDEICQGVSAAHRFKEKDGRLNSVVHRDLKPENVMVVPAEDEESYESVKVVDFGIAKIHEFDLTEGGQIITDMRARMGSLPYMSPEQCKGEEADVRSDVYSLGIMFYELLACRRPFDAKTEWGWRTQHVEVAPPALPEGVDVPPEVLNVALHALAKDPAQRPADARVLLTELRAATKLAASRIEAEKTAEAVRIKIEEAEEEAAAIARKDREEEAAREQRKRDEEMAALRKQLEDEFASLQKQLEGEFAGVADALQAQLGGEAADIAIRRQDKKKAAAAQAASKRQLKERESAAGTALKQQLEEKAAAADLQRALEKRADAATTALQEQHKKSAAAVAADLKRQFGGEAAVEAENLRKQLEAKAASDDVDFRRRLGKKAADAATSLRSEFRNEAAATDLQRALEKRADAATTALQEQLKTGAARTAADLQQQLEKAAANAAANLQERLEVAARASAADLRQQLAKAAVSVVAQRLFDEQTASAAEEKRRRDASAAEEKRRLAAAAEEERQRNTAAEKTKRDAAAAAAKKKLDEEAAARRSAHRRKRALQLAKVVGALTSTLILGVVVVFLGILVYQMIPEKPVVPSNTNLVQPSPAPSPSKPPRAKEVTPAPLLEHKEQVNSIKISPDGRLLASGSVDKSVRLWDIRSGKELLPNLMNHDNGVTSVDLSRDGKLLASSSLDGAVFLWNTQNGTSTRLKQGAGAIVSNDRVFSVAFSPDGNTLAGGSTDGRVYLWDVKTRVETLRSYETRFAILHVIYSPNGETLVGARSPGTENPTPEDKRRRVVLWSSSTGEEIMMALSGYFNFPVRSLLFSPDGKTLYVGVNNKVVLWNMEDDMCACWMVSSNKANVTSLALSPDGNSVVSGRDDGTVELWDIRSQPTDGKTCDMPEDKIRQTPKTLEWSGRKKVRTLAFGREGNYVAGGLEDGTIRFWSISDFK